MGRVVWFFWSSTGIKAFPPVLPLPLHALGYLSRAHPHNTRQQFSFSISLPHSRPSFVCLYSVFQKMDPCHALRAIARFLLFLRNEATGSAAHTAPALCKQLDKPTVAIRRAEIRRIKVGRNLTPNREDTIWTSLYTDAEWNNNQHLTTTFVWNVLSLETVCVWPFIQLILAGWCIFF